MNRYMITRSKISKRSLSCLAFLLLLSGITTDAASVDPVTKQEVIDAHVRNKVYYGNSQVLTPTIVGAPAVETPAVMPQAQPAAPAQLANVAQPTESEQALTPKSVDLSAEDYTAAQGKGDAELLNRKVAFISAAASPLHAVISQLSDLLGIPFRPDENIDRYALVTIKMENVSVRDVLDRIYAMTGIAGDIRNSSIRLFTQDTRTFKLTTPPSEYSFSNTVGSVMNLKKEAQNQSSLNMDSKAKSLDYYRDIEANLKTLVSAEGSFSINKIAGLVTVRDKVQNLRIIENFIQQANAHSHKQVLVKARIHKVTLSDTDAHGIDWDMLFNILNKDISQTVSFGSATIDAVKDLGSSIDLSVNEIDPTHNGEWGTETKTSNLVFQALSSKYDVETVAEPVVLALNNVPTALQEAKLETYIGEVSKTTDSDDNIQYSIKTDELRSGFNMNLIASVVGDDWVIMTLTPSVETVDALTQVDFGDSFVQLPKKTGTIMTSQIKVKSGHLRIIGGLFLQEKRNTGKHIPVLGKIPFIGRYLFGSESTQDVRKEIVIEILPTIVN
jgi:Flp pilus assembly secretin CpaC